MPLSRTVPRWRHARHGPVPEALAAGRSTYQGGSVSAHPRDIADELTAKGVAVSLGGSRYDPTDPVGRLLFNVLGMVAEFERDMISMRTREGMAVARAKGKLKGRQPKLAETQRALLFELHDSGEHTSTDNTAAGSIKQGSPTGRRTREH